VNNSGGAINFTGASITLTTGGNAALNFTNTAATGANVTISGGDLDILTTTGTGINATSTTTGAGSLTISGGDNQVTTGIGRAVNISGVNENITLHDVNASGGSTTAVFISNAGTAGGNQFVVTGTGTTAGSGGVINAISGTDGQTGSGIGVYINNSANISLSNMNFTGGFGNFAIRGDAVNNFTLKDSNFTGSYGSSDAFDEAAIRFGTTASGTNGLTGTAAFLGNNIAGGFEDNLAIYNEAAGSLTMTVADSGAHAAIIGLNNTANGNDGLHIETLAGSLNLTVNGVDFLGARGDMLQTIVGGTATQTLTITNNIFHNTPSNTAAAAGGIYLGGGGNTSNYNVTYNLSNNDFNGSRGDAVHIEYDGLSGNISGVIQSNTIGNANGAFESAQALTGASDAGGRGIAVIQERFAGPGALNHAVRIESNSVADISGQGIYLRSNNASNAGGGVGRLEATVLNNLVQDIGPAGGSGLYAVVGGSGASDVGMMGLQIVGNTLTGGGAAINNAIMLDQSTGSGARYYLPGLTPSPVNGELQVHGPAGNASTVISAFLTDGAHHNTLTNGAGPYQTTQKVDATLAFQVGGSAFVLPVPLLAEPSAFQTWEELAAQQQAVAPLPPDQVSGQPDGADSEPAGSVPGADPAGSAGSDSAPVVAAPSIDDGILTQAALDLLVEAAIQRWGDAGATADQLAAMRAVAISVADMTGIYVGSAVAGAILVDSDGAGHGWFIDTTPGDDSEFAGAALLATADGGAAGKVDLLTVLMHELGHQIGLSDDYRPEDQGGLMYGYIGAGERRLPTATDAAGAGGAAVADNGYLLTPLNQNPFTLPAGKTVDVLVVATLDPFAPGLAPSFANQTTVTYNGALTQTSNTETLSSSSALALDTLSLGNLVFRDNDGNGLFGGGDVGIDGVTVDLYLDSDTDNVPDGAAIASAVTAGGGLYAFANLAPGNYIVGIAASQFTSVPALSGLVPTTMLATSSDPNTNVDNDSNALGSAVTGVLTHFVTLAYNSEPTTDGDADADTNLSVDLGLTPNQPPVFGAGTVTGAATERPDGAVDENAVTHNAGGAIAFTDPDSADTHTVSVTPGGGGYLGTFTPTLADDSTGDGNGSVSWSYAVADSALDGLRGGQIVTQTYNVTVNDGKGGTDTEVVTITLTGANDPVFLDPITALLVTDTAADDTFTPLLGTFTVTDPDIGDTKTFSIVGGGADGSQAGFDLSKSSGYGSLYLNSGTGAYKFIVNDGAVEGLVLDDQVSFGITVVDGGATTDTKTLTINIDGKNDNPDLAAAGPVAENDTAADDSFPDFTGTLAATDRDTGDSSTYSITGGAVSADPGFTYQSIGTYGTLFVNTTSGAYKFVANDMAIEAIKTNQSESFQLVATDTNGGIGAQTLTINVNGANDLPELSAILSASYIDTSVDDSFANYDGTLASSDRDNPETATYSVAGQAADNSVLGFNVSTAGARGILYLNTGTGAYRFAPNDAAIELLKTNVNDSFAFTVTDGSGGTDSKNLVVAFTGVNDRPDLGALGGDSAAPILPETNSGLSGSGTLTATDRDADPLTASLTNFSKSGTTAGLGSSDAALQAMFTIPAAPFSGGANSLGWNFNSGAENFNYLAQGENLILTYRVQVTDGVLASSAQDVVITISGANDAPVLAAIAPQAYVDTAGNDSFVQFTGTLSLTDADASDTHVYSIAGQGVDNSQTGYDRSTASTFGTLYLNSASGAYLFIPNDAGIEAIKSNVALSFALAVTDSAGASDTKTLDIAITGANDTPELSSIPTVTVTDTAADDSFSPIIGSFVGSDRDNPESLTYSVAGSVADGSQSGYDRSVATGFGTLYFASGSGAYKFLVDDANVEAMKGNSGLVFTVGLTDGSAATDFQNFSIQFLGANDTPDIALVGADADAASRSETDGTLAASGSLTASDRDLPEVLTASVAGLVKTGVTAGLLSSDAALQAMMTVTSGPLAAGNGNLAWTFSSGAEAFNYLDEGESLVLTYAIRATDSNAAFASRNVTVTINGTNDAPVLSVVGSDTTGASLNETNGGLVQSGTLTVIDPDQSDAVLPAVIGFTKSGVTAGIVPSDAQLQAMLQLPASIAADPGSANNLGWTFNSGGEAFNYLHTGEMLTLTYTLRGTDDSGATTATQTITINVIGANDPPVVLPATDGQGMVTELPDHDPNENVAILTDSGTIYFADNEVADTHTASFAPQAGGYLGTFALGAVNQVGRTIGWSFTVSDAALNALPQGQLVNQYYTVTIDDGHGGTVDQVIEIDLLGINDAALLTSANVFVEQGPAVVTASGDLDITDEDNPALFLAQTGTPGDWGHFSIDGNGQWSFTADQVFALSPGEFRTDVFTVLAVDGTPTTVAVTITGHDAPAMAHQDLFQTSESSPVGAGRNLFADNSYGPDTDPDTPLQVAAVNNVAGNVGHVLTLPSGAEVTVNADGTFSYNPSHAFDWLTAAVGAANQYGHDSFTYTLAGGSSAMVFVVLAGQESPGDVILGNGLDNAIIGLSGNDTFLLQQAGNDNVWGMTGNDGFYFGAAYNSGDAVDGGDGTDTIALQGDTNTVLGEMDNVELLLAMSGSDTRFGDTANNRYDYDLTTTDANVGAGRILTVMATGLLPGEDLAFDGSAETNGAFRIFAGQGNDHLSGGAGNDGFFFGADGNLTGEDRVIGGGIDSLALRGNYGNPLVLQNATFSGIEVLVLLSGHTNEFGGVIVPGGFDYSLQLADGNVGVGQILDVNATRLGADESLRFYGGNELDGAFRILSGAANDSLFGGAGNDLIYGGLGSDAMGGGGGADTFLYRSAAESTSTGYDAINGFDWREDRIDAPGGVRGFSQSASGALSTASFDADLAAALAGLLGAGQAALFTASSGDQAGNVFAVIDANGVAGYQAGEDLVIWLVSPVLPIDPGAGVIV
jgi:VCBS repeat-containing protein